MILWLLRLLGLWPKKDEEEFVYTACFEFRNELPKNDCRRYPLLHQLYGKTFVR